MLLKKKIINLHYPLFSVLLIFSFSSCSQRYTSEREPLDTLSLGGSAEDSLREEMSFSINPTQPSLPHALNTANAWVDSIFSTLSVDEKIGQLIMVQAFSNMNKRHEDSLFRAVRDYKVGGLVVSLGGPVRQARLMNQLQQASKVPLLLAMDAEWGLGMRLDSTVSYPFQMTLGAIQDDSIIYQMGKEIAAHFKRIGMHINFAPVVDVNNNPQNPIINYRSFGENKYKVAEKGIAYMRGMQNNRIIAVAKHFPGHGDTDVDSHHALPLLNFTRERLDSLEMYPFMELINNDVGGVMVAHLNIPQLDDTKNLPSTLSRPIVTGILKEELDFRGLIFTDAMNMKGVTKHFPKGEGDVRAIIAGNDVLEITENVAVAISKIKRALDNGEITIEDIDEKCKKVLAAKYWVGLHEYQPIEIENLVEDLNTLENDLTRRYMAEASLTVLKNDHPAMPINRNTNLKVATLGIGLGEISYFQKLLEKEGVTSEHYLLAKNATGKSINALKEKLKNYDVVIVGVFGPRKRPGTKLGFSKETTTFTRELTGNPNNVLTFFSNAYTLGQFGTFENTRSLMVTYEYNAFAEEAAARFIAGKSGARGKLPVTVSTQFASGYGLVLKPF